MASGQTPLRKRPYPLETDTPDVAADTAALALALDDAPNAGQGTLAGRPAAEAAGDLYMVQGDGTGANNGILWWDTGSGFVAVNPVDAVAGVASMRTLGTGSQQAAAGNDGRIVGAEQTSRKAAANGYCDLDSGGHVPLSRLSGITGAQLADGAGFLTEALSSTDATAQPGQLLSMSTGGTTASLRTTLGAGDAGVICGVRTGSGISGSSQVTVNAGAQSILLPGGSTVNSFKMGYPNAAVILFWDGGRWLVISGQPDTGWVSFSAASGIISGTRLRATGTVARINGILTNSSGGALSAPSSWGTIPLSYRPSGAQIVAFRADTSAPVWVNVDNTGKVTVLATIPNGVTIEFAETTYPLD